MNPEQVALVAVGVCALALLTGLFLVWRQVVLSRELSAARALSQELGERLVEVERTLLGQSTVATAPPADVHREVEQTYVITHLGEGGVDADVEPAGAPARIDGRLFADIVARESLVKAASLAHGVRTALSPESRNRIRFEMRREVKRQRKGRRAEMKQAWREYQDRQRAGAAEGGSA